MSFNKSRGDKRNALIVASKVGHRVLLLGDKIYGKFGNEIPGLENASIETAPLPTDSPNIDRLSNYTLVVLDYAAFRRDNESVDVRQQDIFEKQMLEALDSGTNFCFVHYRERVPAADQYSYQTEYMSEESIKQCRISQIGFRWLNAFSIKPYRTDDLILTGKLWRGEFKVFFDRWGASYNAFSAYGNGEIDDVIYSHTGNESVAIGFTLNVRSGKIIYLPFQRDFTNKRHIVQGIQTLIDCLLTYLTKLLVDTPQWGKEPFFNEETLIVAECEEIEKRLEEARARLQPFYEAKDLLFQSEYTLETTIPKFISNHLDVQTDRDEKHKEDFWVLDDKNEKIVIAEIKSMVKGFKKSAIFSLYNHREENKLDDSFPGLLVVNCNLQAGSWAEKDRVIDKQDYQVAAQNNILVVRVEDLVRLWDALRVGMLKSKDILNLLSTRRGWLQVKPNLEIAEMK